MRLQCDVFGPNQPISAAHSGEGENFSPPLRWSDAPERCQSFALTMHDLDAPLPGRAECFVHWVIYNISPHTRELRPGLPREEILRSLDALQGINSYGQIGYLGPLPPKGAGPHRYEFTLYALDTELEVDPGLTRSELISNMRGHVLALSKLQGTYARGELRLSA